MDRRGDVCEMFMNESLGKIGGVLQIRNRKLVGCLERRHKLQTKRTQIFLDQGSGMRQKNSQDDVIYLEGIQKVRNLDPDTNCKQ